jgi:hypothetical protein
MSVKRLLITRLYRQSNSPQSVSNLLKVAFWPEGEVYIHPPSLDPCALPPR